jgi:hypothetical protein
VIAAEASGGVLSQIFGEPVLPMLLGVVLGFVVRMEP